MWIEKKLTDFILYLFLIDTIFYKEMEQRDILLKFPVRQGGQITIEQFIPQGLQILRRFKVDKNYRF